MVVLNDCLGKGDPEAISDAPYGGLQHGSFSFHVVL
jgi:hypothetical protein